MVPVPELPSTFTLDDLALLLASAGLRVFQAPTGADLRDRRDVAV